MPFEANGFESVPNVFEQQMFGTRQQAAANGTNGFAAAPLVSYTLGGPANHGPNFYHPDWKDFLLGSESLTRRPLPAEFSAKFSATAKPASERGEELAMTESSAH